MAGRRKRAQGTATVAERGADEGAHERREIQDGSGYEQSRDRRIKENKEKMQKLGLFDLSHNLKSKASLPKRSSNSLSDDKKTKTIPPPGSPRRSSRLKTMVPVSYKEIRPKGKRNSSEEEDVEICIREGSKPEIYMEEHEKLLGDCKTSWTLFVDGYDEDGRIYDSFNGETCHQCRQKTLGLRTHCSKCNLVQGQFCGDCLYTRYGENVIEANENPSWICPACRDICNCSLCRKAKGWMPTGQIYKKVVKLGYKSVAHYLIENYRYKKIKAENSGNVVPPERSNPLEEPFPQDEVYFTAEEPEHSTCDDSEEEIEKVQLLDKKNVDANDGGVRDSVLKEKKVDMGDHDVKTEELRIALSSE